MENTERPLRQTVINGNNNTIKVFNRENDRNTLKLIQLMDEQERNSKFMTNEIIKIVASFAESAKEAIRSTIKKKSKRK